MTETTVSPVVRKMISASRGIISAGPQRWASTLGAGLERFCRYPFTSVSCLLKESTVAEEIDGCGRN
ncbi:hypothetical protein OAF38_00655 [bacterium]|nr:hypothetical protein [bacterium]